MKNTTGQEDFIEECRIAHNKKQDNERCWKDMESSQKTLGKKYKPLRVKKEGLMNKILQKQQCLCPKCEKELVKKFMGEKEKCYNLYLLTCDCGYKYATHGEYFPDIRS